MAIVSERLLSGSRPRRSLSQDRRRRRALALEGLEPRVVMTQLGYGLFDTGLDSTGNVLAGGATDPHYTLPVTQDGTAGMNAVAASNLPAAWHPNGPTSAWIAPSANQAASSSPPGAYEYQTTFTLPTAGGGTGTLSGSISEDNVLLDILINGTSTGFSRANDLGVATPFSLGGPFVTGTNTITFVLQNTGLVPNATGLYVQDLAVNLAPTVATSQPTANVPFGGTVTATGTFADPDAGDTVTLSSSQGTITQSGTQSGTFTFTQANVTDGGPVTITATDNHGNTTTSTLTLAVVAPSITGGGAPITVKSGGAATVVDPNVTITDPGGPNLTSASVSIGTNFTAAEDLLLFTSQNGITGAYNPATGILTLSGSATPAQYQAALRSVAYQDTNADPVTANRSPRMISFSIAPASYDPTNGHFYQFVNNTGISWLDAKAAADATTLFGLKGYLATLTSADEDTFAFSKALSVGWIGGSDAANPGTWVWADGPETGLQFWNGIVGGSPVNGAYQNWAINQPDNSGGNQEYVRFLSNGTWDDLQNTSIVPGYLIEFGGSTGDPTLHLTSAVTANVTSTSDVPVIAAPVALTNAPTATISGTADPGSLVQIYNDANNNGVIDSGETVVATERLAAGQTTFTITTPLTANAANHFLATATEGTAAESGPAVVPTVTSDTIPPVPPTVTSPAAATLVKTGPYQVTGTAEAGSLVQIYDDLNGDGKVDNGEVVVGTEQLAAGQTTFGISVALAANAVNHFLATATDAATNESGVAVAPPITTDSIAPAPVIVTTPAAAVLVNTATYTITGTAEANSLVQIDGNLGIETGRVVIGTEQLTGGATTFSIIVPLETNTPNSYVAFATDAAGNVSSPATVPTITTDTIAPAIPIIINPSAAVGVAPGVFVYTVTGTAQAGSLVKIYGDANANGIIDSGEGVVGTAQLAAGQTSFSFDVTAGSNPPTNGGAEAFNFLVTATDSLGNVSGVAVVPTIVFQAAVPVSPVFTGTVYLDQNASGTLDAGEPGLAGRVVYLDLDNSGVFKTGDPTATTDASGNFSFSGYALGSEPVREDTTQDTDDRYVVDQSATTAAGAVTIGVVPFSPIFPVPVVPNPFTANSGTDPNTRYVQSLYKTILGRAGADAEVAAWVGAMSNGLTDAQVAAQFINSPEHRTDQVAAYYSAFLHRGTDPLAVGWVSELEAGVSEEIVVEGILNSPEFLAAHTDPSLFVRDLYLDVLGRQGEQAGLTAWGTVLASGTSQASVIASFVQSPEANDQIVESLYVAGLHRPEEGPPTDIWSALLDESIAAGTVATGILSSPEYQGNAGPSLLQ